MTLKKAIAHRRNIRVIGFDDAPFQKERGTPVNICGVVCSNTRFEGMLWGEITKDGTDATNTIIELVSQSKFHSQVHAILFDGITVGGFNMINLMECYQQLGLPCIAVMRNKPNLAAFDKALDNFNDANERKRITAQAGELYSLNGFYFQVLGCSPSDAAHTLEQLTDVGKVPEALRLAHFISAAVKTGSSSKRA